MCAEIDFKIISLSSPSTDPNSMQTARQKKTASASEPKLFKTNVFSRQKAMRHTFRFNKQDSGIVVMLESVINGRPSWYTIDRYNDVNSIIQ